ncbi:uncharacterized protein LOC143274278 [Peromyscus maniculatus bairdii]|uniref:uncharacterized protein LOC143274278 n=1 Tax=Peromyscus maniculatus bairdii TaxID=230844 RepID=UPI003FD3935E
MAPHPSQAIALPERVRAPSPQPGPPETAREADGPGQRGEQAPGLGVGSGGGRPGSRRPPRARPSPRLPARGTRSGARGGARARITRLPRADGGPPERPRNRPAPRPPGAPAPPPLRLPCPSSRWTKPPRPGCSGGRRRARRRALRLRPTPVAKCCRNRDSET